MSQSQSEEIVELAKALVKAQTEIVGATKGEVNPFFKSKYATLADYWIAVKEPLSRNGLSIVQIPHTEKEDTLLTTKLFHESGQWISGTLKLNLNKKDMQQMGSAITYARRYMLSSMLSVPVFDDDGEKSMDRDQQNNKPQPIQLKKETKCLPARTVNKLDELILGELRRLTDGFKDKVLLRKIYTKLNLKSFNEIKKLENNKKIELHKSLQNLIAEDFEL